MSREDPGLRRYRQILVMLFLTAALIVAIVGIVALFRGRGFPAFLSLCVVGYLVLLMRGYAADARERSGPPEND